jgi:hypothetical protein
MDVHFQKQRDVADHSSDKLNRIWFYKMKDIFKEIDAKSGCIPQTKKLSFLDLGFVYVELIS